MAAGWSLTRMDDRSRVGPPGRAANTTWSLGYKIDWAHSATTFGTNGKIVQPIGSGEDLLISIALDGNGKIIAAGESDRQFRHSPLPC